MSMVLHQDEIFAFGVWNINALHTGCKFLVVTNEHYEDPYFQGCNHLFNLVQPPDYRETKFSAATTLHCQKSINIVCLAEIPWNFSWASEETLDIFSGFMQSADEGN